MTLMTDLLQFLTVCMCVHGLERQVLSKAFSLLLPPFLYHTHPEAAAAAKQALLQVACNPAAEAADASLP